ncbi:hypothetical protein I79_007549 [Cricetulus griseus]|uniref:Uncharacterized protein n=1 Tax=Cricetulus griseus TaxID=10029 RepID=G3HAU0_CRIGR|nr:hypothetical protein I79_007549 [Cricetulus griseus]
MASSVTGQREEPAVSACQAPDNPIHTNSIGMSPMPPVPVVAMWDLIPMAKVLSTAFMDFPLHKMKMYCVALLSSKITCTPCTYAETTLSGFIITTIHAIRGKVV